MSSSICPPPVFLASLKLASTLDFAFIFRLVHFFLISSTALPLPCAELSLAAMSYQIYFLRLFLSALLPEPHKISPADSISLIRLHSSSLVQFALRDLSIYLVLLINASTQQQFIYTRVRRNDIINFRNTDETQRYLRRQRSIYCISHTQ